MTSGREPSGSPATDDVVYWSDTGRVLHKNPDCPLFLPARVRALAAAERGDWATAIRVRSWDFNEDVEGGGNVYPPESRMPCRRCAW